MNQQKNSNISPRNVFQITSHFSIPAVLLMCFPHIWYDTILEKAVGSRFLAQHLDSSNYTKKSLITNEGEPEIEKHPMLFPANAQTKDVWAGVS